MSDPINASEQAIELEKLLVHFTNALTSTVETLDSAFAHRPGLAERPVIYQIPKMSVSVQMKLSVSQGKVRGILWNKNRDDSAQDFTSTINLEFVATPRSREIGLRRALSYTVPITAGEDVRITQMKLQAYFALKKMAVPLAADGEFGLQTREAVVRFQVHCNLSPTGIVDSPTYQELLRHIPDPAPLSP